jgi:hypothetical protein
VVQTADLRRRDDASGRRRRCKGALLKSLSALVGGVQAVVVHIQAMASPIIVRRENGGSTAAL